MAVPKVDQNVLDEALRMGSHSATLATRYMNMNSKLIDAIKEARVLLKTGRTQAAHERLDRALATTLQVLS